MTAISRRTATFVDRVKGGVAAASLTLGTAATNAAGTCASGRCGQGCGFACGIIGLVAAGGIGLAAMRKRRAASADPEAIETPPS